MTNSGHFEARGRAVSEPIVSDGVAYVSDSSHEFTRGPRHLYALDAQTGQELWRFEVVSTFLSAPALSEDLVYVTTEKSLPYKGNNLGKSTGDIDLT